MAGVRTLVASLVLLVLTGCLQGPPGGGSGEPGPPETLQLERTDCTQLGLFLFFSLDEARALVPEPFAPMDASAFLAPGSQVDEPGALLVAANQCAEGSFAWVLVFVEAGAYPALAGDEADFAFYQLAHYTSDADEGAWLSARGHAVHDATSTIQFAAPPGALPTGGQPGPGQFRVASDEAEIATMTTVAALPFQVDATLVRLWHVSEAGLFAADHHFPVHDVGVGYEAVCSLAPGSPAAEAYGAEDFQGGPLTTELIPDTLIPTTVRFWPGVGP